MPTRQRPAIDRLMERTVRSDSGCLEWTGARVKGYSRISIPVRPGASRFTSGHRLVMEHHLGRPIPPDAVVRHKCDNPSCVELAHLELGTRADNSRDMRERGRSNRGARNGIAKLTEAQVALVRELAASGRSQASIAAEMGIHRGHVNNIIHRRAWAHVPEHAPAQEV